MTTPEPSEGSLPRASQDRATGAVIALAMLPLLWAARSIPPPRFEPLGARFVATLIPSLILALSIALIVRPGRNEHGDHPGTHRLALVAGMFATLCAYCLVVWAKLGPIAYVAASATMAGGVACLVARSLAPGPIARASLGGLVLASLIAYAFETYLYVDIVG